MPATSARLRLCLQPLAGAALVMALSLGTDAQGQESKGDERINESFLSLLVAGDSDAVEPLERVEASWQPGYVPMAIEIIYLSRNRQTSSRLIELLKRKTGQDHGYDLHAWYEWLWNQEAKPYPLYADFKSDLYSLIDPKFAAYFDSARPSRIRLDEIRWGGVVQDGIPPLRQPKMIGAAEADYLADDNVVFGIEVNGDARAYPKRIMAWHEMFVDEVGGVPVCGVYCTLCGSMILYESVHAGRLHELGTSGFLYRSNKLMYDRDTQSLWNTMWGEPVVGPLVEEDIRLKRLSIITTTWGEWRRRHADTQVLSLDTGHRRDYSEGAAYREYFATDELMFNVPELDRRLPNKEEVLGLVFTEHPDQPLAIRADYLSAHPLYHDSVGDLDFVVLTDASGANRVYEARGVEFERWDQDQTVVDGSGVRWTQTESGLRSTDGRMLHRLPAHRAFWFGWYSAYSHTRLVF